MIARKAFSQAAAFGLLLIALPSCGFVNAPYYFAQEMMASDPLEEVAPWAGNIPRYEGPVTSITEPLLVRYRPHSPAPITVISEVVAAEDRRGFLNRTKSSGSQSTVQAGEKLLVRVVFDRIEEKRLNKPTEWQGPITIAADVSHLGDVGGVKVSTPPQLESDKELAEKLIGIMRSMLGKLPTSSVSSGQRIVEGEFTESTSKGREFHTTATFFGTALGLAHYQGRKSLVIDYKAAVTTANLKPRLTVRTDFEGYGIMDVETGAIVFRDVIGSSPPFMVSGRTRKILARERQELLLHKAN